MIVVQFELMEPELMHDDAAKFGGKLIRQFGWLSQTPGDGVVCLYSFPSVEDAMEFGVLCFGDDVDADITEVVPGVFYSHEFK